jgi:hypothetical protein
LKASGVGVRIAAATKAPSHAYLRFRASAFGVTTPMRESSVKISGSSKTSPKASVNFRMNPT